MSHYVPALLGGALIGLSASLTLLLHGRIAGISNILSSSIDKDTPQDQRLWRIVFLLGLTLGALPFLHYFPERFAYQLVRSPWALVVAGALVGVGTRLGSGCTSGHGICGISRGSTRSIVATLTFVSTGAITVFVIQRFFGGTL